MPKTETLSFKITLSAVFWEKLPEYSIYVNDELKIRDTVAGDEKTLISFDHQLSPGPAQLRIQLHNKTSSDTQTENGAIVKDMLLNIDDIVIDDVPLGNVIRQGNYYLDHPQQYQGEVINSLKGCVNLGWNGTYVLDFSIPFYHWLLDYI